MNISKTSVRWGLLVSYMLLMFIVSAIPGNTLKDKGLFEFDKLLHVIEYTLLGLFSGFAFIHPEKISRVTWADYTLAIGWGVLFAVTDELHQYFVPGRMMELNDFIADSAGILLGVLLYRYVFSKLVYRLNGVV